MRPFKIFLCGVPLGFGDDWLLSQLIMQCICTSSIFGDLWRLLLFLAEAE